MFEVSYRPWPDPENTVYEPRVQFFNKDTGLYHILDKEESGCGEEFCVMYSPGLPKPYKYFRIIEATVELHNCTYNKG